ncbi:MAG: polysaccharide deacetylase family protein [Alphaproteobacteria bacterium]|nr:polysaccharide deacetylase family protein [Alphaproteobacteria bacterium]
MRRSYGWRGALVAAAFAGAVWDATPARAEIVTRLPTAERVVALTFDACEARAPATLDRRIVDLLAARGVPYTVFMGGRFARDNAAEVAALARDPRVEIENHSWSHPRDMRTLDDAGVTAEVVKAEIEIFTVTGRRTTLFRFPGGNADARTVGVVEGLGYRVVHWRWPEGDPDPHVSARALVRQTLTRTRPGDVLIFHINGRGVHTADALPQVLDGLTAQGYRFVLLSDPAVGVRARHSSASTAMRTRSVRAPSGKA